MRPAEFRTEPGQFPRVENAEKTAVMAQENLSGPAEIRQGRVPAQGALPQGCGRNPPLARQPVGRIGQYQIQTPA